jgi:hypothetical protein
MVIIRDSTFQNFYTHDSFTTLAFNRLLNTIISCLRLS